MGHDWSKRLKPEAVCSRLLFSIPRRSMRSFRNQLCLPDLTHLFLPPRVVRGASRVICLLSGFIT